MNEIDSKKRNVMFIVLLIGTLISSLLQTALTTALPNIMADFSISSTTGQWLTSGFSLFMGIMIPATAFLIKRIPTKILFLTSMMFFSVGSLISAVAPLFSILLIGRIIQALGTGILLSLTQVVILTIYPTAQQGKMMGIYGLAASVSPVLVPTLMGILIDYMNWRFIFWIGLFVALIDMVFAFIFVSNVLAIEKIKFDILSFLTISVTFTGILIGLGNLGTAPFLSISIGVPLGVAFISGVIYIYRSFHINDPLLNLAVFKNKKYAIAVILSMLLYFILISASTLFPIYTQTLHHLSATNSGLIMMPGSLLMAIFSPFVGHLYDKFGIKKILIIGTAILLISSLLMINLTSSTNIIFLIIVWTSRSVALACIMMPLVTWSVSELSKEEIPSASALLTTLRTISGAIGSATMIALMSYVSNINSNESTIVSIKGMNITFQVLAGIVGIMLLLSIFSIKNSNFESNN